MHTIKTVFFTRAQIAVLCIVLLGAVFWSHSVSAQQLPECGVVKSDGTMSESTYKTVSRAIEDMGAERTDAAESGLRSLVDKVSGYELAIVLQTLGYAQVQQDNMQAALTSFEKALATNALPRQAHEDLLLNTGQMYLVSKQLDKGIETLLNFLKVTCNKTPHQIHLALASAYAEKESYKQALQQVDLALALVEQPQEQWLQLKLALHYQLGDFTSSAETLLELIVMVPDKQDYWRQLSGTLMQIEKEEDALAVLALAERQGYLNSEMDLRNLANLYLMLNIPWKAATLLADGISKGIIEPSLVNYEYLSEAWISAYEWDRAELALIEAASKAEDGKLWKRLAQVRIENDDWAGARQALQQALEKGVSDTGETYYLLGIAAYNTGDHAAAITALRTASNSGSYANESRLWLNHLVSEQRRVASSASLESSIQE
jgi:hypothetical protein